MAVHEQVLEAALRICRSRRGWTFRPAEVVQALPELNVGSVRTHVMSRCCVNAPVHHPHRRPYFRRLRRGVYEILPAFRNRGRIELHVQASDPMIARYEAGIDRSLVQGNLRLSVEQRLGNLQDWMSSMSEIRGSAPRPPHHRGP